MKFFVMGECMSSARSSGHVAYQNGCNPLALADEFGPFGPRGLPAQGSEIRKLEKAMAVPGKFRENRWKKFPGSRNA